MDSVVSSNYKIIQKIEEDAYITVFSAINTKTGLPVAIKIQPIPCIKSSLMEEYLVYKFIIKGGQAIDKGLPCIYSYSETSKKRRLTMELLGPDLSKLLKQCNRKFSLKTVLMIADQMLKCIEYVHNRGYLHNSIKKDSFCIGLGKLAHKIYLIDFGIATQYKREANSFSASYGKQDDLKQIGYLIAQLFIGSPRWEEQYRKILTSPIVSAHILKDFPQEFVEYFEHVRGLDSTMKPNYNYLRGLFKKVLLKHDYKFDYRYDWVIKEEEERIKPLKQEVEQVEVERSHGIEPKDNESFHNERYTRKARRQN